MEKFNLTQTGEDVQQILNNATPQSDLTTEIERAQAAEQTLQGNIDAEELRAKAAERDLEQADGTLQGNIDAEELRAKAAEQANRNLISGIQTKIPSAATSDNKLVDKNYVDTADASMQSAIEGILALIPQAATALNQLADKAFVNSSIATNTGTFKGTYNVVLDLELFYDADHAQIALMLGSKIISAKNNDYCYVQVPNSNETPTSINHTDRYKFNGSAWAYEYTLNNSGYTAAQWGAINSGITSALVTALTNLLAVVPSTATAQNKLTDMASVTAAIIAAIPACKGQFDTLVDLEAVADAKPGDLGIVRTWGAAGYPLFSFYQYLNNAWSPFFALDNYYQMNKPASDNTQLATFANGMGKYEIPKHIVNIGTELEPVYQNQLYQSDFQINGAARTNTIYVIKYDFTLTENITIPANCVLEFDGGSLSGDSEIVLTLDKTLIIGAPRFDISNFSGTILNDEVHLSWFTNGMSSSTDYSKNDHDTFIKAMKLASRKSNGWLNGDKIPVFIEGQVEITEDYGNIGMTMLNIRFRPLHDDDSLFYYNSIRQWQGNYSPITDSIFTCLKGANDIPFKDVCCIRMYVWYNTCYTYWRDIQANSFTGYFFLNQTYLQEVTFENISISSGCGFIGFNSDGHYAGNKGSCQIVHTLNLNHNIGSSNYTDYTSYKNVFDFYNVMELTMVNTVIQGLASGTDIKAISVKCNDLNGGNNRAFVKLDGFWVEYPAGNVDNAIFIEENGVYTFTKQNVSKVIITNANVHATLNLEQRILRDIILDIPDNSRYITAYANANIMGAVTDANGNDAYTLLNKGVLRLNINKGTGWRGTDDYPNIITYNKVIDALKLHIETNDNWYQSSRRKNGVCDNNGITCLKIWNDFTSMYYSTAEIFMPKDFHFTNFQGPLVVRIVYRATILVDVTEDNINDVYFRSGYISGTLGGTNPNIISPKVGDAAGTTEGWKEVFSVIKIGSYDSSWTGAIQIALRNVKVEYA